MLWFEVADLIIFIFVSIYSINRVAWSILVWYDPSGFDQMVTAIHLANFGTITFFIHLLDVYIRESYTHTSDSECSWNAKIGGIQLVLSYFAIWIFYWQRHRALRRGHSIRMLSNIGIWLMAFCFLAGCAFYLLFWDEKVGDGGKCVIAPHYFFGSSVPDSIICLELTVFFDMVCSIYLCATFFAPICSDLKILERSVLGDLTLRAQASNEEQRYRCLTEGGVRKAGDNAIEINESVRRMRRVLTRTAWAAALATLSTVITLSVFVWAKSIHWILNEKLFLIFLDGILNVYSVHMTFEWKMRWFWYWFQRRKLEKQKRLQTSTIDKPL